MIGTDIASENPKYMLLQISISTFIFVQVQAVVSPDSTYAEIAKSYYVRL